MSNGHEDDEDVGLVAGCQEQSKNILDSDRPMRAPASDDVAGAKEHRLEGVAADDGGKAAHEEGGEGEHSALDHSEACSASDDDIGGDGGVVDGGSDDVGRGVDDGGREGAWSRSWRAASDDQRQQGEQWLADEVMGAVYQPYEDVIDGQVEDHDDIDAVSTSCWDPQ